MALRSWASPITPVALLHRAALCFLPLESQLCSVTSLPAAPRPPAHSLPISSFTYLLVFTAFPSVLSLRPVAVQVPAHLSLLRIPLALHSRSLAEERGGREKKGGAKERKASLCQGPSSDQDWIGGRRGLMSEPVGGGEGLTLECLYLFSDIASVI